MSVSERAHIDIIEGFFFLKKIRENFVRTVETVRNIEVSVPRSSTVHVSANVDVDVGEG